MKTITTLLIAISASFSLNANADAVYNDPSIGDVFPMAEVSYQPNEVTYVQDTGEKVWSVEFEQWVNPADFNAEAELTVMDALRELDVNPPASGGIDEKGVFIYDDTAGEYQLQ